ncbi:major facilitator superfamily transporter [Hypoxylon rubiginosum]|uniref:Major facilitator superfamily transporter n=1 Tax=Hypoxylon rubiginosum TaxID=110542 RepID=A0ACC0D369_9PEZI|nr:major facilitator superfamily transporter [Hypoxylon rubiginosum]
MSAEKRTRSSVQDVAGALENVSAGYSSSETMNESFIVSWDGGDDDPLSPRNLSKARKWVIVFVVCTASLCVTAASSIYTSTYDQMEAEFGNSRLVSILGLSLFVLGIACGPLLFSPLSEFYGRRPIYLVAWTVYVIWIVPQAVARNIETILIARFLDGFSGSTFLAVSGGTVGDLFAKHELQLPMAIFSVSPFLGPCIGPLIGGSINYNLNWRWTYYCLLMWAFALLVAIVVFIPETYHPVLLRRKAVQLRQSTGDLRWKAPMELSSKSIPRTIGISLLRPFQLLIFEPMCLCLDIFSAILLAILYLFFGAFPLVFSTNYGFNLWQVGLSFLGICCGLIIGTMFDPVWHRIRARLIENLDGEIAGEGHGEPEFRLPSAIVGACIVPIGLFIFAWTSTPTTHWIVPMIGCMIFGIGSLSQQSKVDAYPDYAASALAANAFVRCLFSAIFPLFGRQMYQGLGFQWASSVVAFLTVAMMPFPYVFFKYGKSLRARSRFAKS